MTRGPGGSGPVRQARARVHGASGLPRRTPFSLPSGRRHRDRFAGPGDRRGSGRRRAGRGVLPRGGPMPALSAHASAGGVSPLTPESCQHVLTVAPYAPVTRTLTAKKPVPATTARADSKSWSSRECAGRSGVTVRWEAVTNATKLRLTG